MCAKSGEVPCGFCALAIARLLHKTHKDLTAADINVRWQMKLIFISIIFALGLNINATMACDPNNPAKNFTDIQRLYESSEVVAHLGWENPMGGSSEHGVKRLWKGKLGTSTYVGNGGYSTSIIFASRPYISGPLISNGSPCMNSINLLRAVTALYGEGYKPEGENTESIMNQTISLWYISIMLLVLTTISVLTLKLMLSNKGVK